MSDRLVRLALRLLGWFCPSVLLEEIEGDLLQKLARDIRTHGEKRAKRRLAWNVVRYFRPGIVLRNKFSMELNQAYMLRNYFKVGFRHLMRSKVFSIINVLGLSVGIVAFVLIVQYVSFEMSFDKFHKNSEEIYRAALEFHEDGELKNTTAKNYVKMSVMLREHLPLIKDITGFTKMPANTGFLFSYQNKIFNEGGGFLYADSSFFKVFQSLLVRGAAEKALDDKHDLVISESMAKKIFGDSDPLGQRIGNLGENGDELGYVVSGIFKDIPENAHFHANFVGVVNFEEWENLDTWHGFLHTYIVLPHGTDLSRVASQLEGLNKELEKAHPKTKGAKVMLQPIADIHLHSHLSDELEAGGNKNLVYILLAIGVVILMIAWINYINIETARFINRAREVGIRRIVGSGKTDLAIQFLVEYAMITFVSAVTACVMLQLIFPQFSFLTGIPISRLQFFSPLVWLSSCGLFVVGSTLVGIYPALFLLKLDPMSTLKGKISGSMRGRTMQKSLIVIQFITSISLIAFLMVIFQQVDFMRMSNRNIELDQVISLRNPTAYMSQQNDEKLRDYKTLENKLLQNSAIKGVATSSAIPGAEIGFTYVDLIKRNLGDPYDPTRYKTLFIDYKFIPVYGLKLKAGRNYSEQNGEDENWATLILNESAIRVLGFSSAEDAIGQDVQFMAVEKWDKYKIVGVIEDYHHEAIKKEVYPTIFFLNHNIGQQVYYSIQLSAGSNPQDALAYIEKAWKEVFPQKPFEFFFLNDYYDQQFKSELHFRRIFTLFAGIAIFIACLGILGMTLFQANARLKEISIRKVLGASAANLIALLSRENIRLVVLSAILAMPLIFIAANEWLSSYPERIEISAIFFLAPIAIILLTVILTSFFQTLKAAYTNPVDHLKHE
jgi:putative ABC transport system permease protein